MKLGDLTTHNKQYFFYLFPDGDTVTRAWGIFEDGYGWGTPSQICRFPTF
jgi:hypothetical protein